MCSAPGSEKLFAQKKFKGIILIRLNATMSLQWPGHSEPGESPAGLMNGCWRPRAEEITVPGANQPTQWVVYAIWRISLWMECCFTFLPTLRVISLFNYTCFTECEMVYLCAFNCISLKPFNEHELNKFLCLVGLFCTLIIFSEITDFGSSPYISYWGSQGQKRKKLDIKH